MSTTAVRTRLNEIQHLRDLYRREQDDVVRCEPFIVRVYSWASRGHQL